MIQNFQWAYLILSDRKLLEDAQVVQSSTFYQFIASFLGDKNCFIRNISKFQRWPWKTNEGIHRTATCARMKCARSEMRRRDGKHEITSWTPEVQTKFFNSRASNFTLSILSLSIWEPQIIFFSIKHFFKKFKISKSDFSPSVTWTSLTSCLTTSTANGNRRPVIMRHCSPARTRPSGGNSYRW